MRSTEKLKSYKIFICVGVAILLAIFVYLRYDLFLRTDDVGFRNILSGLFTGEPEAHTTYLRYPLSFLLASLYKIFPGVYWYFVFFEIVNYGCLALILYTLIRSIKKHTILVTILITALFVAFWLPNLLTLEWTTTAGLISATAIIWYFFIPQDERKWKAIINYAVPVILFALSYNIRTSVFEMAIPFMGMAVVVKWLRNKGEIHKEFIIKETVFIALTFIVIIGSSAANSIAYSGEEWQEEKAYSHYRAMLIDRYGIPEYDEYADVYEASGITKEMYDIIKDDCNFMLASKGVLTSENLKDIAELAKENYYADRTILGMIKHCMRTRLEDAFSDDYIVYTNIFYLGMLVAFLIALYRKAWLEAGADIVFVVGFEALWVYLYYGGRLPIWVGTSLYLLGFIVLILLLFRESLVNYISNNHTVQIVAALGIGCLLGGGVMQVTQDNSEQANKASLIQEVKLYCENHKGNVYYRDFHSFAENDGREKVKAGDEFEAANFFPANGWTVNLPYNDQYMPTDGSQELCSWISKQDNFYIIIRNDRAEGVCSRTEDLFASRGISCELELDDELQISNGDKVNVYHFICN